MNLQPLKITPTFKSIQPVAFVWIAALLLSVAGFSQGNAYFNQTPPADKAKLFAPGLISDEYGNRDMAISPTGNELFYTLQFNYGAISTIMYSKKVNGKWSAPEVADFCGKFKDLEPAFSFDGKRLYFSSNRPITDTGIQKDYDIWFVTNENGQWVHPTNMQSPVNSDKDEFYASVAKNNNIYFTRGVDNREEDIMYCQFKGQQYAEAKSLSDSVNSVGDEFNAFVDPDEQYIIFSGYKRPDGMGSGDLYISVKNKTGEWQKARNLGSLINSPQLDYCPYVTPDKKYFFFTSNRSDIKSPFTKAATIKELKALMEAPGNGFDNIYWLPASEVLKE